MQAMMLVAQNAGTARRPRHGHVGSDLLRQIGASAGVAVVGAMITLRFTEGLPLAVVD